MTSSPTLSPTVPTEFPTASPLNIFRNNATVTDVAEPVANGLGIIVVVAALVIWLYTDIVESVYLYFNNVKDNIEEKKKTNAIVTPIRNRHGASSFIRFLSWGSVTALFISAWVTYTISLNDAKPVKTFYNPRDMIAVALSSWSFACIWLVYFGWHRLYTYSLYGNVTDIPGWSDWFRGYLKFQAFGFYFAYIGFPVAAASVIYSYTNAEIITVGDTTINQGILWFTLGISLLLAVDSLTSVFNFYTRLENFVLEFMTDYLYVDLKKNKKETEKDKIFFGDALVSKIFGEKSDTMVGLIPYIFVPSWLHVFSNSLFWYAAGYGIYRDTAQATVYYLVLGALPLFFTLINGNKNYYPAYQLACLFWFYVIVYFLAGVIPNDANFNLMAVDKSSNPVTDFGSSIKFVSWFSFSLAILSFFLNIRNLFFETKEENSKVTP